MPYSVVNYKTVKDGEGAVRLDSEHYSKRYLDIKRKIESKKFHYLSEILSKPIVTGHTPSMANDSYYGGNVAFIKTDNVREHYIVNSFSHYLSDRGNKKIKRSELENNDVVLTIIGASFDVVGRASLVTEEMLPANINQNIALIRVNDKKFNPKLLSVYLNSYYGKNYLYYLSRQTEQVNLNNKEVERLLVPAFSNSIADLISRMVDKSYQLKNQSKSLYSQSENLLLSEIGLLDLQPQHQASFIKNYSNTQSEERIDADYFQPKYEKLISQIAQSPIGYTHFSEVIDIKNDNFVPEPNTFYKYIELSNITSDGQINGHTSAEGQELPTRARRKVRTGNVILSSIEGSLESIALIDQDYDNALCSTGFYVLDSDVINPEALLVLCKSSIIQHQLKRGCSGTILTAINQGELDKIILPKIDQELQNNLVAKVSKVFQLKQNSKLLLEIAKHGVEKAIEHDEQTAIDWINKEVNKLGLNL